MNTLQDDQEVVRLLWHSQHSLLMRIKRLTPSIVLLLSQKPPGMKLLDIKKTRDKDSTNYRRRRQHTAFWQKLDSHMKIGLVCHCFAGLLTLALGVSETTADILKYGPASSQVRLSSFNRVTSYFKPT